MTLAWSEPALGELAVVYGGRVVECREPRRWEVF